MKLKRNTDTVDIEKRAIGIQADDGTRLGVYHDGTALGVGRATDRANKIVMAANALALLEQAVEQWGERIDDEEQDINGADAVDWLSAFIQDAQDILKIEGFKGLLKR